MDQNILDNGKKEYSTDMVELFILIRL